MIKIKITFLNNSKAIKIYLQLNCYYKKIIPIDVISQCI
ncbi:protein of unknown function [Xenorhabdus bovienii]|uniref:Uncharacterized protein n=1 Tax=Xenorhabdus bovienii TaxID=40576 RepID=A0A0B6X655_XENBV|nr:protein of unknown function [Xenorhabdus bovienii]